MKLRELSAETKQRPFCSQQYLPFHRQISTDQQLIWWLTPMAVLYRRAGLSSLGWARHHVASHPIAFWRFGPPSSDRRPIPVRACTAHMCIRLCSCNAGRWGSLGSGEGHGSYRRSTLALPGCPPWSSWSLGLQCVLCGSRLSGLGDQRMPVQPSAVRGEWFCPRDRLKTRAHLRAQLGVPQCSKCAFSFPWSAL